MTAMSVIVFFVGDILSTPGHCGERLYVVEGIHLGALGQENVIELSPIDKRTPDAHCKKQAMFVPQELLQAGVAANLFTLTTP